MKKFFVRFLIIFSAIILQVSSVPLFFDSDWTVDIVLMMVLAWTLVEGFEDFLKWAVLAGLLYDLATFSPVGLSVMIFTILAYSVSFFSKRLSVEIGGSGVLLVVFFVTAATVGERAIRLLYEFGTVFIAADVSVLATTAQNFIYATVVNLLIFFVIFSTLGKTVRARH